MNNIDFQNGFVCGMATKGMIKSGQSYSPNIYNDLNVLGYFYIDFFKSVAISGLGVLNASLTVLGDGTTPLVVTDFLKLTSSKYMIFCNIAGNSNVTVVNKATGFLKFDADGTPVTAFSQSFVVADTSPRARGNTFVDTNTYSTSSLLSAYKLTCTATVSAPLDTPVPAAASSSIAVDTYATAIDSSYRLSVTMSATSITFA